MLVLHPTESNVLRRKFIKNFVNTNSNYYKNYIDKKIQFFDGLCYVGYLWDCLFSSTAISESELSQFLTNKKNIYVMWDIHSCERILIPNYWKYPKDCILRLSKWSLNLKDNLPEDIYVFDDTFAWSAIYTHETDKKGNRYCVYSTSITAVK